MTRPNSLTTRLRTWLAKTLDPLPGDHEAWCVNCELNGGRTTVVGSQAARSHAMLHVSSGARKVVKIKIREKADAI